MKTKSHFSITETTVMSVIGAIATAIVTLVPAWSPEVKIIVASLGGVVVAIFPLVNSIHKLADSTLAGRQALASSNVSAHDVEQNAIAVARSEAQKVLANVDLTSAVSAAVDAKNLPSLEGVGREELNRVLVSIFPGASGQINYLLPPVTAAPAAKASVVPDPAPATFGSPALGADAAI